MTFSNHFPEEAVWLTPGGGDLYYTYSFTNTVGAGGGTVPKVLATARNTDAVFAKLIQSMDGGGSTVRTVSMTY